MKTKVFEFFLNLPKSPAAQFNEAFKLYQASPGHNFGQVRYLNAAGYTKPILDNLLYDLKQLHGITDAKIRIAKRKAQPMPEVNPFTLPVFGKYAKGNAKRKAFVIKNKIDTAGKFSNKEMDPAIAKWTEEKAAEWEKEQLSIKTDLADKLAISTKNSIDAVKNLGEALDGLDADLTEETKDLEVIGDLPEDIKEYISLHDEFTFLDEDDCPEELKILVSDKRKLYNRWKEARAKLLVLIPEEGKEPIPMTDKEIYELVAGAVENFEANQAIYAEMDHYNNEKVILGKHPIFAERILKGKVDKMTPEELNKRLSNLDNYIRRDGRKIEKETDADKIVALNKKIEDWKIELSLVNAKLGISAK